MRMDHFVSFFFKFLNFWLRNFRAGNIPSEFYREQRL
jgi:hypothetical protein